MIFGVIHFSDDGYEGKQPMAWKECYSEYWFKKKKLQESMDRCTGRRQLTEILFKTALNTVRSTSLFSRLFDKTEFMDPQSGDISRDNIYHGDAFSPPFIGAWPEFLLDRL